MEEDRRSGGISRKKIGTQLTILTCISLALVLGGRASWAASLDDSLNTVTDTISTKLLVTEETNIPSTTTERTSNAIPEAEDNASDILKKKYNAKKIGESGIPQSVPLEAKPYPYIHKTQNQLDNNKKTVPAIVNDQLDNSIQQTKRSDHNKSLNQTTTTTTTVHNVTTNDITSTSELSTIEVTTSTTIGTTENIDITIVTDITPTTATTTVTADTTITDTAGTTIANNESTETTIDLSSTTTATTTTTATSSSQTSESTTMQQDVWSTETNSESTYQNTQQTTKPTSSFVETSTVSNDILQIDNDKSTTPTKEDALTTKLLLNHRPKELNIDADITTRSVESAPTMKTQEETSTVMMNEEPTIITTATTEGSTTMTASVLTTVDKVPATTLITTTEKPMTTQPTMPATIKIITSTTPLPIKIIPTVSSTKETTTESTPIATTVEIVTVPLTTTTPKTTTTLKTTTEAKIITTAKPMVATTMGITTTTENIKEILITTPDSKDTYRVVTIGQDADSESTTNIVSRTVPTDDVTVLIKITFEGTWEDVCSKLPVLRQSLADLVNSSAEKTISPEQIVFYQTQCTDNLTPKSLKTEMPLTSVLVYIVDKNGSLDSTLTKSLPSLYEKSQIDFPLTIQSVDLVQEPIEDSGGNSIVIISVSCVVVACLILLAGIVFIMKKRQGRFNYGERCRPVSLDAYSLDSVGSAYNSVRRSKIGLRSSKRSYGNPTFEDSSTVPSHPLNFASLSSFCNESNAISEEFAGIPQVSSKIDELPPGAEVKNRYANVIPLPETRVPLQRLNNDPLTEYINASYVRGPKNANKYYIACQAPTESTVADFWRMIWEQQSKVIIMLTDLFENGVEKCTEYIPPLEITDCHRLYGDYQVTLKKREAKEKYGISMLHLKNLENNTFREVWHIWYLWPTKGVPTDGAGIIAVLFEARALQRGATGPIVIHCSPGTGRTGTAIALDLAIRQYEITRTVDVPRVVYTIRRDRAGSVQTKEQYAFIYKALNHYASKLAGGAIDTT